MKDIPYLMIVVALAFSVFAEFETRGRSILGWAVVLVCVALLWARVVT
jgi:hypothetical protein